MTLIEQTLLLDSIATQLRSEHGDAPSSIVYYLCSAGGITDTTTRLTTDNGERSARSSRTARDAAKQLREVMYQPGVGTWFEMEMVIPSEGKVQTRFNYDEEPSNVVPFPPGAYALDQRKFPRDVEHQPEWLQRKIADGLIEIGES